MMTIDLPTYFQKSTNSNDLIVHQVNGNSVVLLGRHQETGRSRINLSQHVIVFGIEGKKFFHSLEDDTVLNKNEAIFLKKGQYLTTEKIMEKKSFKSIMFFFNNDMLLDFFKKNAKYFLHSNSSGIGKSYFKFNESPILVGYINSLLPYFEHRSPLSEPLFQLKLEELLMNLALNDGQNTFKTFLANINNERSYNLTEVMEKNFTRNLRIEDFAYLNHMSISSFKRQFEQTFSSSPAKWLKEKRMEKAEYMLQISNKNINEVAMEVGFESTSHFIQVFKSFYGMTPKKFQVLNLSGK
ncbi:MAG TPA: hypothetical protein DEF18_11435 [Muricauda sp.]|nr:AraC family transcriptional regulator [uncultured Allomuricauda sp.]MBC74248.1 hypothetical protein [Allomuricauda sp.]HBU78703.1 hypothetical protein [Allomuricauda sp.]